MMQLRLDRDSFSTQSTLGKLYLDDLYIAETLELPWDDGRNTPDKDCIPYGNYQVILSHSPHLGYTTPELLNVPGREDIRIHIANWPKDVLGCIAVGAIRGQDFVGNSRLAFDGLMAKLVEPIVIAIDQVGVPGFQPVDVGDGTA